MRANWVKMRNGLTFGAQSRKFFRMLLLYFVTCQACFYFEGQQWIKKNCPQFFPFAYLPLWLINTNSVKVAIAQSPAITTSEIYLSVIERIASRAKIKCGLSIGSVASLIILRGRYFFKTVTDDVLRLCILRNR